MYTRKAELLVHRARQTEYLKVSSPSYLLTQKLPTVTYSFYKNKEWGLGIIHTLFSIAL